jgi:hypothetical protein
MLSALVSVPAAYARGFGGTPGVVVGGVHAGGVPAGGSHPSGGAVHAGVEAPRSLHVEGVHAQHAALPTDAGFGSALITPGRRAGAAAPERFRGERMEYPGAEGRQGPSSEVRQALFPARAGQRVPGHRVAPLAPSVAEARAFAAKDSFHHYELYDRRWHQDHPHAWWPAGWAGREPWAWATWPALGPWIGWQAAAAPIYYDYGNNIVYLDNDVYYGNQPVATAEQYYQQAEMLAESVPAAPAADQWMSLGVFSLVQGTQTNSDKVFQLAVSRSGALGGNLSDTLTGATLPVQGAVDQASGRAAWIVGDNRTVVYETGISDLTQDQAPVLVHFSATVTEQWMLVRLPPPPSQ